MNWEPGITMEQIELAVIQSALKHFDGNKSRAARALGVSVRTIRNKVAKYPELFEFKISSLKIENLCKSKGTE
jgi:DNA-binding NtrC family response regulator